MINELDKVTCCTLRLIFGPMLSRENYTILIFHYFQDATGVVRFPDFLLLMANKVSIMRIVLFVSFCEISKPKCHILLESSMQRELKRGWF